ncbi:hypothetical protein BH18THE1_BH18THE1_01650 [soil metagenome]
MLRIIVRQGLIGKFPSIISTMNRVTIIKFLRISTRQDFLISSTAVLLLSMSIIIYTNGFSSSALMVASNQSVGNLNSTLIQAITIAQQSISNNSFAVAAFGEKINGGVAYSIILASHGTDFYDVTIDADNGHLLSTEKLSKQELEKRHLEHSQMVLTEPQLTNNTFVH